MRVSVGAESGRCGRSKESGEIGVQTGRFVWWWLFLYLPCTGDHLGSVNGWSVAYCQKTEPDDRSLIASL